jgi:hypothetical protein
MSELVGFDRLGRVIRPPLWSSGQSYWLQIQPPAHAGFARGYLIP